LAPALRRYGFAFVLQYQKLTVCFYIDRAESAIASVGFFCPQDGIWGVTTRTHFIKHATLHARCAGGQDGPCSAPALRRYGFAFILIALASVYVILYAAKLQQRNTQKNHSVQQKIADTPLHNSATTAYLCYTSTWRGSEFNMAPPWE
jgi:hypothetical protein